MTSNLPQPTNKPTERNKPLPASKIVRHEVHFEGKLNGFWAVIFGLILVLAFGALFLLGLATLTLIVWIAGAAVLASVVLALFRSLGSGAKRP